MNFASSHSLQKEERNSSHAKNQVSLAPHYKQEANRAKVTEKDH
jgi:hypothetical protein